jgi:hypothetical protein
MKREFEEFFNPLEDEDIESLLLPQRNEKLRSLSASFFNRKYLLSVTGGSLRNQRQAVFVKPKQGAQKIIVGLLWNAMFGRKFKVIHWNILFDLFIRTIDNNRASRAMLTVLRLTAASKDVRDMFSNMDSVSRIVKRKMDKDKAEQFLNQLVNSFGMQFPKTAPVINELLDISQGNYNPPKPKRPQRKRGYDDKGHLPDETNPIVLPELSVQVEDKEDLFDLLLRQTDRYFKFFYQG